MSTASAHAPAASRRGLHVVLIAAVVLASLGVALLAPARPVEAQSSAVTTSDLNLRRGPGTRYAVRAVMPPGASVLVIKETRNGYYHVVYNGIHGHAAGQYLDFGGGGGGTGTAYTTSSLNLRAGPSTGDRVLAVMPSGAAVELTGDSANGFLGVVYNGTFGWAYGDYISSDGGGGDGGGGSTGTARTTSALNLRSRARSTASVILVMPAGARVELTGQSENGFLGVIYNGTAGWAHGSYLDTGGGGGGGGGGGSIVWPFEGGGAWTVIQGYNGGTHQGQYYYALDLAKSGGGTTGSSVLSPVNGTVLWNDPGSGGLCIDMGNGYAIAMFHTTFSGSLGRGTQVSQGQWLGTISGPGGPGYAVTPHLDMTLWDISGGGRVAAPYVGGNAISGTAFPDIGVYNMHYGTVIYT